MSDGVESAKSRWKTGLVAGLAGLLIGGGAIALAQRQGVVDPERERIEAIVRDYILAHPEIIPEAVQRLQDKQAASVVASNRAALETPYHGAWAGAENGDVTLVEFFDYACGYCRQSVADVDRLLREDDRLKVVWRELPVLGPESETAAEASLAAAKAGRFRAFHDKLFGLGGPDASTIAGARAAAGIAAAPVPADAGTEIAKNLELAQAIGATGTPTFVVGDRVLQGAVGYEALKEAVAAARGQ